MVKQDHTLQSFKDAFAQTQGTNLPEWFRAYQNQSFDTFLAKGFPGRKDEAWRYTPLTKLADEKFLPATHVKAATLPKSFESLKNPNAVQIVLINGQVSSELSSSLDALKGIRITPLAHAITEEPELLKRIFATETTSALDSLLNLNAAFVRDGVVIRISADTKMEKVIQIFSIQTGSTESKTLIAPRHVLILDAYAQATVNEFSLADDNAVYLTDSVTEIELKEGAKLAYNQTQLESAEATSIHHTRVLQAQHSVLNSSHFTFGAKTLRHNLHVRLAGAEALAHLYGLYAIKPNHHADHHTVIEHVVPHTQSEQVYKGIVQDLGKAVFNGKVLVHKDAQKTNAAQLNRNLLLGAKAEANTKPELEILADDVKCSHGATVGQLSPEEIFYLQSRAIPKDLAAKMLVRGFAEDVLTRLEDATLKKSLSQLMMKEFFES